jgi:hypothetical protein
MRVLIITKSKDGSSTTRFEIFFSGRRRRTEAEQAVLLVEFLTLLPTASARTRRRLGRGGAARQTLPTLYYVPYSNRF